MSHKLLPCTTTTKCILLPVCKFKKSINCNELHQFFYSGDNFDIIEEVFPNLHVLNYNNKKTNIKVLIKSWTKNE